ncbi:MAG: helix-turn-helix transcriptional regulator [Lachnospira sp.]|jgi:DNA-binding Xre family transcriptional regulator|nr:helix-turn-helix transcriptional regulator [Lachnospira sp.]
MTVSYKKLWHILIDKGMKKKDLEALAGINHYTMNKMSREENVTIDTIGKICIALHCKVEDIIDFLPDDEN